MIIVPGYGLLDHAPVHLQCTFARSQGSGIIYHMNTSHLKDPRKIQDMWDHTVEKHDERGSDSTDILLDGFEQARVIARAWGKERAKE